MKRTILAAVVGTTLIAMSGTVEAIIHGYPDNLFHPNVGFIAIKSIGFLFYLWIIRYNYSNTFFQRRP